jgi:hypothetical protein
MFDNKDHFKINIQITVTVQRTAPTAKPASRLIDRVMHKTPHSKVIEGVMYDAAERHLYITFRSGDTYRYDRVEFYVLQELLDAPSTGQYFSRYIRDAYTTHKLN